MLSSKQAYAYMSCDLQSCFTLCYKLQSEHLRAGALLQQQYLNTRLDRCVESYVEIAQSNDWRLRETGREIYTHQSIITQGWNEGIEPRLIQLRVVPKSSISTGTLDITTILCVCVCCVWRANSWTDMERVLNQQNLGNITPH